MTVYSISEVCPTYFAWLMATILLVDDRRYAKPILALFTIAVGAAELFTRKHWGNPMYMDIFNHYLQHFPNQCTLHENMRIVRAAFFPTFYLFLLTVLDNTLDAVPK